MHMDLGWDILELGIVEVACMDLDFEEDMPFVEEERKSFGLVVVEGMLVEVAVEGMLVEWAAEGRLEVVVDRLEQEAGCTVEAEQAELEQE